MSHIQVWQVLHDEDLHPYHNSQLQHLEPGDLAQGMCPCQMNDSIPSTTKCHFIHGWSTLYTREGINNSQNTQMWSHGNPNLTRVTNFQRTFSLHVWCGLLSKKVITAAQQFNMWQVLILHEDDLPGQMYFLHDRAPLHYTQDVREHLHKNFSSCLLGCGGPLAQPARSPHLITLDFYLWGHMMALVYETKVDSRIVLWHCTLCNSMCIYIYIQSNLGSQT